MQRETVHIYSKADRPSAAVLPAYTINPTPSRDRPSSIPKALLTPQGAGRGAPAGQWSIVSNHPMQLDRRCAPPWTPTSRRRTSAAAVGACELRPPWRIAWTSPTTMPSEKRDPGLDASSRSPWWLYSQTARLPHRPIIPCPPLDFMLRSRALPQ